MLRELKTLVPYAKKHRWFYLLGVVFLVVTNAGQIAIPGLLGRAVDTVSEGGYGLGDVARPLAAMVGFALAVAVGRFGWRTTIFGASRRIEYKLRNRVYDHLLLLSPSFYSRWKTGDLMARATNDMNNVRNAVGMGFVSALDGIFMTVAILSIMFARNPRVAALTILPAPVVTVLVLGVGKALGVRFRAVQEGFSRMSEHVQEALSGIRVLKSFGRESYSVARFSDRNDEYRDRNLRLVRIWGLFFPIITFLSGFTTLLLLRFGGTSVIVGEMSPGTFVAFLGYLEMLIWPMLGAGFTVNLLQRGAASLARINEILNEEPDIISPPNPVIRVPGGRLRVEGLDFGFEGSEPAILSNVSLAIEEGQTVGILGRTGSGKSTLLRLIPRLLDPPPGTVYLGGVDVREYELGTLRGYVGMVPQDTFLFSASVRENIAYGNPEADEEAIVDAARLSTIDRDLVDFPAGYDTEIGERGISLSGGQKQRVAISRAVLADPELLIFDDALSAVDTETEERILSRFIQRRTGKTNIIVSNRVTTLSGADVIFVMDEGRIVDAGTHAELIGRDGLYSQIARLQSLSGGVAS